MRRLPAAALALVAALAAASGCDRPGDQPAAAEEEPAGLASEVVFKRTGGLAGFEDRVEISRDGTVRIQLTGGRPAAKTLTSEETARLAGLLTDSGLFQEGGAFRSQGADLISYVVQYNGVTVAADEEKVPDELRPVLDRLMEILGGP